jgi:hypothetical protein
MRKWDPEIVCHVPQVNIFPDDDRPVAPAAQLEAFNAIAGQTFELCFAAINCKGGWRRSIRFLINAEKVAGEYVASGFDRLLPLQEEFRGLLRDLIRAQRRAVIRRALLCREEEIPEWKEILNGWDFGPDAAEDYWAVERALRRGQDIFADLRRKVG